MTERFKGKSHRGETSKRYSEGLENLDGDTKTLNGCLDSMEQIFEKSLQEGKDIRANEVWMSLDDKYHRLLEARGYYGEEITKSRERYNRLREKIDDAIHGTRERGAIRVSSGGIRTVAMR